MNETANNSGGSAPSTENEVGIDDRIFRTMVIVVALTVVGRSVGEAPGLLLTSPLVRAAATAENPSGVSIAT